MGLVLGRKAGSDDDQAGIGRGRGRVSAALRVELGLDGALDDVPPTAAAAVNDLAHAVLRHADGHLGRPATVRLARLGPTLSLWLIDPECSPACLKASGSLSGEPARGMTGIRDARLSLDEASGGGVRLHWMLILAEPPGLEASEESGRRNPGREGVPTTRA